MDLLTFSTPISIFNPPILPPRPTKLSACILGSASGSCSSLKWVSSPHKKLGHLGQPGLDSRLDFGFWGAGKRVFEPSFSFRNGGGFESEGGEDAFYMRKGVELAKQAIGWTSPNPMVGCVIVKDGKIVGQGFHPMAGQPHGEVFALRDAGELAENATAYVTLEPCNHHGRTPPCTEALIKAKVKKVVVGMVDPNPIVSSRGINRLREAGIEVIVGVEEDLCKKLNEAFIHKMLTGKPLVALRYSISVNGVLSDQFGENVMARGGYYSRLLQEYDAVIHSTTTMTQEFSFLASQEPNARQPLHIFIAKNPNSFTQILNLPMETDCKAIIFADKEATPESQMSQKGIETVVLDHVSLDAILEYCSRQGVCNVLVDLRGKLEDLEEVLGEGLDTNSVQKVVVEVLPCWAGDTSFSSSAMTSLTQSKRLKNFSTKILGNSALLEGYF